MSANRRINTAVLIFLVAPMALAGCGLVSFDPRLNNGGGGNLVSAGLKLAQGNLAGLTQDELQVVSDQARQIIASAAPSAPTLPPLTDAQADALLAFYAANGLTSFDGIGAFFRTAESNPLSIKGLGELAQAFLGQQTGLNFDPATFTRQDAENLLNAVLMGV